MNRIQGIVATSAAVLLPVASTLAGPVFGSASYSAAMTFTDGGPGTTMTLAWDGVNYYSSNGGGPGSPILKYDAAGNLLGSTSPTPGIDFRSVFTNASNQLLARGFSTSTIWVQGATFGTFTPLLSLSGGPANAQSAVVLNTANTAYLARSGVTVERWDLAGNALASVTLSSNPCVGYPQDRGIAAAGGYWLTYCSQTVYAYDATGLLLDQATLAGAGTGFDSHFSYSFANGKFWVVDAARGLWRGYDVGLGNGGGQVPEPGALALLGLGLAGLGLGRRRRNAARD